jgi:hypothetical protein
MKVKIVKQKKCLPPEAKTRVKNAGKDTQTSAEPNSFDKGKQGFSDNQSNGNEI